MAYEQQKHIAPSSRNWKSEIKVQAWLVEGPLPGHALLIVSSHVDEAREPCGLSSIKALILFMRVPLSWPSPLPKALPTYDIAFGVRISTY